MLLAGLASDNLDVSLVQTIFQREHHAGRKILTSRNSLGVAAAVVPVAVIAVFLFNVFFSYLHTLSSYSGSDV